MGAATRRSAASLYSALEADIMITHGGMSSMTECIFCEVPVMGYPLSYPLSVDWDQPGYAAKGCLPQAWFKG